MGAMNASSLIDAVSELILRVGTSDVELRPVTGLAVQGEDVGDGVSLDGVVAIVKLRNVRRYAAVKLHGSPPYNRISSRGSDLKSFTHRALGHVIWHRLVSRSDASPGTR